MTKEACAHENFRADVCVNRLTDTGMFSADIAIKCTDCDEPFRFVGVPGGLDFERPMCSPNAQELRAPIQPRSVMGEGWLLPGPYTFKVPPKSAQDSES